MSHGGTSFASCHSLAGSPCPLGAHRRTENPASGRGSGRAGGLTFGKQAYCVVEIPRGEEAADIAKKLRDPLSSYSVEFLFPRMPRRRFSHVSQSPR